MKRRLIDERRGIGELLRDQRKETYRELTHVSRADAGEYGIYLGVDQDSSISIRKYYIVYGGLPAIQIEEVFAESRFR